MREPTPKAAALAALILGTVACQHGNNDASSVTPSTPQRGTLLQTPPTLVKTYSPSAMLGQLIGSELGQVLLQLTYTPICNVSVYHLEYETVDPSGALTPASGALMVPSGGSNCQGGRPIVLYAHATATDRAYDISNLTAADNGEGLVMAAVFAATGYIVVAPNYVGYDTSTLAYHPFLNADQQSKDMTDALTAARSALPTAAAPATTDGGKLFLNGYSQGGFVSMAAHRALQTAGVSVTASAFMSGPYALSAFGDAIFEGQVNASAVENFVMLASSYQHAYGNIYTNSSDVFNTVYATGIDTLLPSTTPLSTLQSEGKLPTALFSSTPPNPTYAAQTPATTPANLASIFAAGFGPAYLVNNSSRLNYLQDAAAAPDGGVPTLTSGVPPASPANTFRQALKMNDLRDWTPTAPVLLCGGNSDPTVFFFNTTLMQRYWTVTAPATGLSVLDVDDATSSDPYARFKTGFAAAVVLVRAAAIAGGATDGGSAAVLAKYHAGLVPPFCLSAAKVFFDGH
jgi:hypothetical protein